MTDGYWTEPGTVVARGRELVMLNHAGQWLAPGMLLSWLEPPDPHPDKGWVLLREGYGEDASSADPAHPKGGLYQDKQGLVWQKRGNTLVNLMPSLFGAPSQFLREVNWGDLICYVPFNSVNDPDQTVRVGSGTIRVESGSIHGQSERDKSVPCRDCDAGIVSIHVCPQLLKPMVRSLLNEMLADGGSGHTLRKCCGSVLLTAGRHTGMNPCRCQFQEGHPDSHRCQCQREWR